MERDSTANTERIDDGVVATLRRASVVLYILVGLLAVGVLIWWSLYGAGVGDIDPPASKINASLGLLLLAIAGLLTRSRLTAIRYGLCAVVIAIGSLTLLEWIGVPVGIDELFIEDPMTVTDPGRMAPQTAIALILAGASIATVGWRRASLSQALILVAGAIAMIALVGHASGVETLTGSAGFVAMRLPLAATILLLTFARLAGDPDHGWMMVFSAPGDAGTLARRVIPAVLVLPVLGALLVYAGRKAGIWTAAVGEWVLLIAVITALLVIVFRLADELQQAERERNASRERSRSFFELSADMLCTVGHDHHFAELNESWTRVLGFDLDELRSRPAIEFVHPDDREMTVSVADDALELPPGSVELENRYITKDGGWRWLSWSIRYAPHDGAYMYGRATDITARKEAEEKLEYMASHDQLTSLPNRRTFEERLNEHLVQAARYGWRGALLAVDLDHLKQVNDGNGHAAGDELLCTAANRMLDGLRESDLVGRLGGDEFAVLMPDADQLTAESVAKKVAALLAESRDGEERSPIASIGVAVIGGPVAAADLFARADRALYAAKRAGGGKVRVAPEQASGPAQPPSEEGEEPAPRLVV